MNDRLYYTNIDNNVVRMYNMLSMHGIIVCSSSGALAIQKAVLEGYYKDIIWDVFVSQIQPYYNVYALIQPLVFQDKEYGGVDHHYTKFSLEPNYYPFPENYINTTNVSNMICSVKR